MKTKLIPNCNFYEIVCVRGPISRIYYCGTYTSIFSKVGKKFITYYERSYSCIPRLISLDKDWVIKNGFKFKNIQVESYGKIPYQKEFQVQSTYYFEIRWPNKTYSNRLKRIKYES